MIVTALRRHLPGVLLAAGLGVAALAPAPSLAQAAPKAPLTEEQKAAIGPLIREYLLQNPEVIQEALAELDNRQKEAEKVATRKALSEVKDALLKSPRNIVIGNPNGDVTLVEFFDYNCGYCKRSMGDLADLVASDPKLRIVIRDFPILGPDSVEASKVAVAARHQIPPAKYFDFHRQLLESKGRVGKDKALSVAQSFGADVDRLRKEMESADTREAITETAKIADSLKLGGTPVFIVGEEVMMGSQGLDPLRTSIANMRQCGKATCG